MHRTLLVGLLLAVSAPSALAANPDPNKRYVRCEDGTRSTCRDVVTLLGPKEARVQVQLTKDWCPYLKPVAFNAWKFVAQGKIRRGKFRAVATYNTAPSDAPNDPAGYVARWTIDGQWTSKSRLRLKIRGEITKENAATPVCGGIVARETHQLKAVDF